MQRTILSTLALAALLLPAATAQANTYDVYSCWAGSGTFRNPNASSAAWIKDRSAAGGHFTYGDDCGINSTSGSMSLVSLTGDLATRGQYAEWSFRTPAGTTLSRGRLYRRAWTYGSGTGGSSQRNYLTTLADGASFSGDSDGGSDAPYGSRGTGELTNHGIVDANLVDLNLAPRSAASLVYRVGCGFDAGCPTAHASGPAPNYFASGVEIFGAIVSISDITPPSLDIGQSGLFDGGTQSEIRPALVHTAADVSGIQRLAVYADGQPLPIGALDFEPDVNRCLWWKQAPCQNVTEQEIPVDTRALADGAHALIVKAFDAANNEKASSTQYVNVKNAGDPPASPADSPSSPTTSRPAGTDGLPNGVSAQSAANSTSAAGPKLTVVFDQNKKSAVKAKYGRMIVVRGRLDDGSGAAISSAQVDYSALASKAGARRQSLGSVRTDSNGEFFLTVATKLGSRQLRFAYRPQLGGAVAVTSEAKLEVVAPVSLKVGPKHVHNKHAVTFSGKLGAGPIPRKGKLVNLQVVVDGRWNTFATVRSSKSGKFKYRYRFKRTYGRAKYRFRALSRFEAAYPFVAGHSKTVSVRVN
jgi:hypothetical protein